MLELVSSPQQKKFGLDKPSATLSVGLGSSKATLTLGGFTGDQRFFLGRAQMWRAKFSPEFTRNQVVTGSNAPPYMRINGPVSNVDDWYSAFNVQPGDKLYIAPDQRVRLW